MAPPITTLMFYVVETTDIELLLDGTEAETPVFFLQLGDQGEGKDLELIGKVFREAGELPRGRPTRYVKVPPGIYWLSSTNTLKYAIDANACRVYSKPDKDPWPPPPPPPHKPSLALLGNYKEMFDELVGPGGESEGHVWSTVTSSRVEPPEFTEIKP